MNSNDPTLPEWAAVMYSESPNFKEVTQLFALYYQEHSFEKTIHTQYFKRWVNAVQPFVQADGSIKFPTAEERMLIEAEIKNSREMRGNDTWQFAGPDVHYDADGSMTPGFRHANIYCHDRSATNPDLLFCGTESGGAYKSTDAGQHWEHVTDNYLIGWVSAIRIHPTNEDFVLMSAANDLWRSTDGGQTWEVIGQPSFVTMNISAWEFAFSPFDPNIIFAACNEGLFRSDDNGDNWEELLLNECMTIAFKPDEPNVVYTIQYEPGLNYSRFYKSENNGDSWTMFDQGWFNNTMGAIEIRGGRLATTAADPERVYALLVGYQENGSQVITNGWVGTWVSYDAGLEWELPHELIGTPYTEEHPNLMNFVGDDGDYTQIHYNTTMVASQLDADKVLIGGLNLWKSNDACATYEGVGGYIGGIAYFHVDQQEIRIYKTSETTEEIWISNDGGISFSDNFMESHENRNFGIRAVNLWGYDQGWNEDMMVGGRYHNGNMAYHENYPQGEFLALGGGEAATGYVNYSDENKSLFSDIGGRILPESLNETSEYFSMTLSPNESYWINSSSRIMFDNEYFDVAWLGNDNKLFRSTNGGSSFGLFHEFGSNENNQVLWIEQSYADHEVMYVHQAFNNTSKLWKTADGGASWNEVDIPLNNREMVFTTSGNNADELWVAYYYGNNGFKVYHTTNGGESWDNITSAQMIDQQPWAIAHQYGTDGGVYLAMLNGKVYYKNNSMEDWVDYSAGLPVSTEPLRIVPYYKGQKIRLACWNLGVWEAPFYEPSELIADFAAEYGTYFCPGDEVHFVDHSVAGPDATYEWSFPGATPSSSSEKNPTVVYSTIGTFDVSLTVTDGESTATVIKPAYISSTSAGDIPVIEGFESGYFQDNWKFAHSTGGSSNWAVGNLAGGYDQSDYSMYFDNYYNDVQGNRDEIWTEKFSFAGSMVPGQLIFDVAYAEYGGQYTDTLAVLISTDCGNTWTELWVQGGDDLQTSPDNSNPFTPLADEWKTDTIALDEYWNDEELIIAFQNRGHWGNIIYVDNINIDYQDVSIEENVLENAIGLFPNPATHYLRLNGSNIPQGKYSLNIFDLNGKKIKEEEFMLYGNNFEKIIQIQDLAPGLYTLQLNTGKVEVVKKFEVVRDSE